MKYKEILNMKKISVLLIALLLVASVGFADPVEVGSGAINVYGKIGEGQVSFTVIPEPSVPRIDLVNNALVQPDAAGVLLGEWIFSAIRQSTEPTYTVTYTYPALRIANDPLTSIAYEILEYNGATYEVKATTETTSWVGEVGDSSELRDIAVRLIEAVPTTAPASENYSSTITIALTSN
jgi:hypothetical protein